MHENQIVHMRLCGSHKVAWEDACNFVEKSNSSYEYLKFTTNDSEGTRKVLSEWNLKHQVKPLLSKNEDPARKNERSNYLNELSNEELGDLLRS